MRALAAAVLWAFLARPAAGDLLLNEVLYDPDGADEGAEFVELWNPGDAPALLAGVTIEAGDGASGGAWTVVWSGSAPDTVAPHAPWLIPGASLVGTMQNGPDAVRLLRGGVVLDLLGYGPLTTPSLFEGAPAPDAPSGESLARAADGVDTDVNADDWAVSSAPTPGRANHPETGLSFRVPPVALRPEVPWPGDVVVAAARVLCTGRRALAAGAWSVALEPAETPGVTLASADGPSIAPGESVDVPLSFRAPSIRGPFAVRALVRAAAPEGALLDSARLEARAGAGPAAVSEFAFRGPAGEWVEVECLEAVPDLGALALSDRTGRPARVDSSGARRGAPAGSRLVLAESPAALRSRYALPESLVLGLRDAWPVLNDSDGEDGQADVIRLFGPGGSLWDSVPYTASYSERGGSVERLGSDLPSAARDTWAESVDPSGATPGRPNSLGTAPPGSRSRGALIAAPVRALLRSGGEARTRVLLRLTAEARGRRLHIEVRDLRGRTRRVLAGGQRFAGEAVLAWDGRDDLGEPVPPGIYTVRAEADAEEAQPPRDTTLSIWVAEEAAP